MGHSSSHVNVLSASHRHFAPLASTHTVTQMTGGHAEMHPKRDPKHVCRWASPWVHVQRSKNALGLVNFWILLQLHFIHPDQTVTSWHLCYSPHDLRSQLRHHFHIIWRYKASEQINNILISFSNFMIFKYIKWSKKSSLKFNPLPFNHHEHTSLAKMT